MNIDGFEIERKYLIRCPGAELLAQCASRSFITQTYLAGRDGHGGERVRKRVYADRTEYTHTEKRKINAMRREEREREISREEYEALLQRADPERVTVEKTRYCLRRAGKIFEIDVYPFWSDRAVMEIELGSEEERVTLPEEIELIREITQDKRYTNRAIAKEIPQEEI